MALRGARPDARRGRRLRVWQELQTLLLLLLHFEPDMAADYRVYRRQHRVVP